MKEVCDMKQYRVTSLVHHCISDAMEYEEERPDLGNSEELDSCLTSMERPFFGLYLLKAQAIFPLIKILQPRPVPLLIFLRVLLLQATDILRQLFQDFLFELTLRLGRACFDPILAEFESFRRRGTCLDLPSLSSGG